MGRRMRSKIIGIGLSRTGTQSLTDVLVETSLNIIHYPNEKEIYSMGNDGFTDVQGAARYRELDMRFPNSKFIYTIRDKKTWLKSCEVYFTKKSYQYLSDRARSYRKALYGSEVWDKEYFSHAYDEHDKGVREYFAKRPKDILILDLFSGDKPDKLFEFLDLPNPPDDFPHANKLADKGWAK